MAHKLYNFLVCFILKVHDSESSLGQPDILVISDSTEVTLMFLGFVNTVWLSRPVKMDFGTWIYGNGRTDQTSQSRE